MTVIYDNLLDPHVPEKLGRQWYPDERDHRYKIEGAPRRMNPDHGWQYWSREGWWGDQGLHPWCVAYAMLHYVADGPAKWQQENPAVSPELLYCEAQKKDPWVGDCSNPQYDGTTLRSGAKVLRELGIISEFRWAFTFEEVIGALATQGPLVIGTSWYSGMTWPSEANVLLPAGAFEGGHAYVLNGVDLSREVVRVKNSWGQGWADEGSAWLTFEGLRFLMEDEWFEACQLR